MNNSDVHRSDAETPDNEGALQKMHSEPHLACTCRTRQASRMIQSKASKVAESVSTISGLNPLYRDVFPTTARWPCRVASGIRVSAADWVAWLAKQID